MAQQIEVKNPKGLKETLMLAMYIGERTDININRQLFERRIKAVIKELEKLEAK